MDRIKKEDLDTILEWFNKSDLSSATVEYDTQGIFKVKLSRLSQEKTQGLENRSQQQITSQTSQNSSSNVVEKSTDKSTKVASDQLTIKAPIVGTFYRASSPDTPPFVQVGEKIKKGQALCILEAMKVMNELEAEFDMEIVSVLVENAQLVEFDQPLFEVVPL